MMETSSRYPFATAAGAPIPLDLVNPVGFVALPIGTSSSSLYNFPEGVEAVELIATVECMVGFGAQPLPPVEGELQDNVMYLPRDMIRFICPTNKAISVRGYRSTGGILICNFLATWSAVGLAPQYGRG